MDDTISNAPDNKSQNNLAECDYLTGLANRRGLYDYYLALSKETVIHAMFIDIDNFKRVNDIYGHSMGDKLLINISHLIKGHVEGFASRIGGDEYVILLNGSLSQEEIEKTAQSLLSDLETIDFRKDILSLISLSIGIVLQQSAAQSLDEVLAKCDTAMYQAKYNGKNRYTIYKSYDKALETKRNIELEMEDALKNGEFHVYFQPKVNMVSSKLYGAEALSRWIHPIDGLRPPNNYIPFFEKNGFISQLDMYIFEEACRIKSTWVGKKYEHIPISVNMSRLHLYNKKFPDILENIAKKYHINTEELEIEITESTFIIDSAELIKTVDLLHARGFLVSIDDFGSGFSALNLLKDLSVDTIKIDKEFLHVSSNNSRGKKVIRNVIALCRDLKLNVVTEGIETKEQIDFITRAGCQIAQGFYYAKPLPLDEFEAFAEKYSSNFASNITFHLNGDLKSDDGSKEGIFCGEGFSYQDGIFKNSKSLHFPGGNSFENVAEFPPDCIVNDSFTISMWLKPETLHFWSVALYTKFQTGFCAICPLAWEGHSSFRIRDSKEVNGWYDLSGHQLQAGKWYQYAATYNAQTETCIVFINGEVVYIMENVPTNRYVVQIMMGGDPYQPSYHGNICEFVLYNEAKDYNFMRELHESYTQNEKFIAFDTNNEEF